MFRGFWPEKHQAHACAVDELKDRVSELELNNPRDVDEEEDDSAREPSPVPYNDDWYHAGQESDMEEDAKQQRRGEEKQAVGGVPVAPDDPEAYEDEPFDPFEEDWDSVVETEEIKDPNWCFECYCTQTSAESEVNQDYQRLKQIRTEGMGKMSQIALCRTLQNEYNTTIRPYQTYKDKAVSLKNWRDHPTLHTINSDVVEEASLKFLCAAIRHVEKTTFRRNKRKHDQQTLDDKKLNLWLKLEDRRKRLMVEHRNRQCGNV